MFGQTIWALVHLLIYIFILSSDPKEYKVLQGSFTWEEARNECSNQTGKLVEPKSGTISDGVSVIGIEALAAGEGVKHGFWIGIWKEIDKDDYYYASDNSPIIDSNSNQTCNSKKCFYIPITIQTHPTIQIEQWVGECCLKKKFSAVCELITGKLRT